MHINKSRGSKCGLAIMSYQIAKQMSFTINGFSKCGFLSVNRYVFVDADFTNSDGLLEKNGAILLAIISCY